jgi:hypothetical protein
LRPACAKDIQKNRRWSVGNAGEQMRILRSSIAWTILTVCAAGPAAGQNRPAAMRPQPAPAELHYSVVYTGRLFGFFRYPAEQTDAVNRCSDVTGRQPVRRSRC